MRHNIGLALSGGGIKGLAHIGLLHLFDKYQIKPDLVAGTSMGAIIGALYSRGLSAEEIETRVLDHLPTAKDKLVDLVKKRRRLLKWIKVFSYESAKGGIVSASGLFTYLFDELNGLSFHDLDTPFVAITTNLYSGDQVPIRSGEVLSAVKASMAVPGIFAPVEIDGVTLVDGGLVNNLPCDVLKTCSVKIACDVISLPQEEQPTMLGAINGALNIMICNTTKMHLKLNPVDLYLRIDTDGIDAYNFNKIREALRRGRSISTEFEKQFVTLMESIA